MHGACEGKPESIHLTHPNSLVGNGGIGRDVGVYFESGSRSERRPKSNGGQSRLFGLNLP